MVAIDSNPSVVAARRVRLRCCDGGVRQDRDERNCGDRSGGGTGTAAAAAVSAATRPAERRGGGSAGCGRGSPPAGLSRRFPPAAHRWCSAWACSDGRPDLAWEDHRPRRNHQRTGRHDHRNLDIDVDADLGRRRRIGDQRGRRREHDVGRDHAHLAATHRGRQLREPLNLPGRHAVLDGGAAPDAHHRAQNQAPHPAPHPPLVNHGGAQLQFRGQRRRGTPWPRSSASLRPRTRPPGDQTHRRGHDV